MKYVCKNISLIFILISIFFYSVNAQINYTQKEKNTSVFQKIDSDFTLKNITKDEFALLMAQAVFSPADLPSEYKNLEINGEGTWIFVKIFNLWNTLDKVTQKKLMDFGFNEFGAMAEPTYLASESETDHFKFHYSISAGDTNAVNSTDSDLNGIPDYIDTVMTAFEYVYSKEIDVMGFNEPPSDSGTIGGNSKYDIYIEKLNGNFLGLTSPYNEIGDNPNSNTTVEKNAYTSYIRIRNNYFEYTNYSQSAYLLTTIAHEYFHAVQFGYDGEDKSWLLESTATWMEDEVYDNLNTNYSFLQNWFTFTYLALDSTPSELANHWYGSFVFFKYISEHLGGYATVRKIWEKSIEYDSKIKDYSFTEINDALVSVGTTFKETFENFVLANLYQNIAPYDYEEAGSYPEIRVTRNFFKTKKGNNYDSKRHSTRYFKIFPNTLPGTLDEIEITVTPQDANTDMSLIVTTNNNNIINVAKPIISGGKFIYTLQNSSSNNEIYAVVVNSDTAATNFTIDVSYKGNLIQLSNTNKYSYGRLSDNYYVYKQNIQSGFIVSEYDLKYGSVFQYTFNDTDGLDAYLGKTNGDLFIIADETNTSTQKKYGKHYYLKELAGDFQLYIMPAVDEDRMFFYGIKYLGGNNDIIGIFTSDLSNGDPQPLLDMTNTDFKIDQIHSEGNNFVALKNSKTNSPQNDLLYYNNNSLNTFYSLNNGQKIWSVVFSNNFAAWSESDGGFSNKNIKAYDFDTDSLRTIRADDGLDVYSVATSSKKIVWWENINGVTKIKLWMNDSTTTIRNTFNGLYLNDNGQSTASYDIPIDTGGFAWMEDDFNLYYYSFTSFQLSSYDLSNYFTDKFLTTYLVRLSGDNIIIEAISDLTLDKVGIYLFNLGDIVTGIDNNLASLPKEFTLFQNYPNPFNPNTTISYHLSESSKVTIKIYDILGKEIATLIDKTQNAGNYKINFNAVNLASGVYFYSLKTGNFVQTKKMLLLK